MVWKIVAIAMVGVFAVLILIGMIKAHNIKSSFAAPTSAQIDYAKELAIDKFESIGGNTSAFQIRVEDRMRRPHDDISNRTILQVVFYNDTTTHLFLVDVNSGKVIMHSETEMYEKPLDEIRHNDKFPFGSGLPWPEIPRVK